MKVPMKFTSAGAIRAGAGNSKMRLASPVLELLLTFAMVFVALPQTASAHQDAQQQDPQQQSGDPSQQGAQQQEQGQGQPYTQQTPEQLQQLVAPIALYPDSLVAQILAATTFPAEIVEADRWVQAHSDLKGDALAQAVDQQPWDPSVKALTAFPTVLGNMDKNISWTSSLGDAYYNQQQDVMDAVQVMRQKAQAAGNLKSTEQQTVQAQGSTIVIQPANPEVVYVPAYDPWAVYGYPLLAWPGWYPYPGIWWGGPGFYWGAGFGIGWYGGYGWGWGHWGTDWHNHYIAYNHNRYYSNSRTFYNRNAYYRQGGERGVNTNVRNGYENRGENARAGEANRGERENTRDNAHSGDVFNHPGGSAKPFEGDDKAARGYNNESRGQTNTRSSAFGGYDHGGESRSYSSRGQSSFGGGGGGFHGGGGGGGGHGGGGHR